MCAVPTGPDRWDYGRLYIYRCERLWLSYHTHPQSQELFANALAYQYAWSLCRKRKSNTLGSVNLWNMFICQSVFASNVPADCYSSSIARCSSSRLEDTTREVEFHLQANLPQLILVTGQLREYGTRVTHVSELKDRYRE